MVRLILLLLPVLTVAGCKATPHVANVAQAQPKLANPASVNCEEKGGRVVIETDGGGGQYGVCLFEDNRQCEEWALLHRECPVGGIKVTGYVTQAARYCAIRGGAYTVTKQATSDSPEEGDCQLADGTICAASAFYDGTCPKE
jgi:putative hemolysin